MILLMGKILLEYHYKLKFKVEWLAQLVNIYSGEIAMRKRCVWFVVVMLLLLCVGQAMAYYNPITGRFLSRDPRGELGFETMQMAAMSVRGNVNRIASMEDVWQILRRENIRTSAPVSFRPTQGEIFVRMGQRFSNEDTNPYLFVENDPVGRIDALGLSSVTFNSITVKRKEVLWMNILKSALGLPTSGGDKYGHWWIEFNGESYGWWPKNPVGLAGTLTGVPGELNGQSYFGGTPTMDPHHGDAADIDFHPNRRDFWWWYKLHYGSAAGTKCKCATQDQVKDCARAFANAYSGSWSYPLGQNCHSFQKEMMEKCCMKKP